MKNNGLHIIRTSIVIAYALLFSYAAITKLMDYAQFRVQLQQSPILTTIAPLVAIGIPILELLFALGLFIKPLQTISLYGSLFLMSCFTVYIYQILHYSEFIPCSCGGILENMGWKTHLLFNIAFIALAILAILINTPSQRRYTDSQYT